jgi:2-polyprenyl-3-methyl-5-hydroxy-6-metoxy-1,4-benzoquinol methylase
MSTTPTPPESTGEDALTASQPETRFKFGSNWADFLRSLTEERIMVAENSLKEMLGVQSLSGKSFIDIGSGSGLFSLSAKRLGARVHSFDYDPDSVACTRSLKERFFPGDDSWRVERASALDAGYMSSLGQFDVVYSWGVLHHTGDLWRAMGIIPPLVAHGGTVFISIYNDQGTASRIWWRIKKLYCMTPSGLKWAILLPCLLRLWGPTTIRDLFLLRPFRTWRTYAKNRGMSPWHDVVDWVGGFPFEVATPEQVLAWAHSHGLAEVRMLLCGKKGLGCNQFVLQRGSAGKQAGGPMDAADSGPASASAKP